MVDFLLYLLSLLHLMASGGARVTLVLQIISSASARVFVIWYRCIPLLYKNLFQIINKTNNYIKVLTQQTFLIVIKGNFKGQCMSHFCQYCQ
jgi:hypothetical protein